MISVTFFVTHIFDHQSKKISILRVVETISGVGIPSLRYASIGGRYFDERCFGTPDIFS